MGWSGGSQIACDMIKVVNDSCSCDKTKKKIFVGLINALKDHDWDNACECLGECDIFDAAVFEVHPDWDDDEEYDD